MSKSLKTIAIFSIKAETGVSLIGFYSVLCEVRAHSVIISYCRSA